MTTVETVEIVAPAPGHTIPEEALHAPIAPSAMKMSMACLASLKPLPTPIPRLTSTYAEEGTRAHKLLDKVLNAKTPEERGVLLLSCVDVEMRNHIKTLARTIDRVLNEIGHENVFEFHTEKQVRFSDNIYGTLDVAILYVRKGVKKAYILDLKYGQGTPVPAEANEQLLTYLIALLKTANWDAKEATIAIYQPRNFEVADKKLDQWKVSETQIKAWITQLKRHEKKALKVLDGTAKNVKEVPGEHCKFCPRKPICISHARYASVDGLIVLDQAEPLQLQLNGTEELQAQADSGQEPRLPRRRVQARELSDEQLNQVLLHADDIRGFLKEVESFVAARALSATPLKGWKLIQGRSNRVWIESDEAKLAEKLKRLGIEKPFKEILKGIGELENEVGKKVLASLLYKPPGKPKLVPEHVKGTPIDPKIYTAAIDMLGAMEDIE